MFCKQKVCFFTERNSAEKKQPTFSCIFTPLSNTSTHAAHRPTTPASSAGSRRRAAARHTTRLRGKLSAAGPPGPTRPGPSTPALQARRRRPPPRPARPGPATSSGGAGGSAVLMAPRSPQPRPPPGPALRLRRPERWHRRGGAEAGTALNSLAAAAAGHRDLPAVRGFDVWGPMSPSVQPLAAWGRGCWAPYEQRSVDGPRRGSGFCSRLSQP